MPHLSSFARIDSMTEARSSVRFGRYRPIIARAPGFIIPAGLRLRRGGSGIQAVCGLSARIRVGAPYGHLQADPRERPWPQIPDAKKKDPPKRVEEEHKDEPSLCGYLTDCCRLKAISQMA
jgi:hypothetical protein